MRVPLLVRFLFVITSPIDASRSAAASARNWSDRPEGPSAVLRDRFLQPELISSKCCKLGYSDERNLFACWKGRNRPLGAEASGQSSRSFALPGLVRKAKRG